MTGGKRPGAGRKKAQHTIATEHARAYVVARITAELEPILTAQIEAAKGMYVQEFNAEKEPIRVYHRPPDLKAGEYLLNQNIGRPKETLEHEGEVTLKIDF